MDDYYNEGLNEAGHKEDEDMFYNDVVQEDYDLMHVDVMLRHAFDRF